MRRLTCIVYNLWRRLRGCKEVTRNELIPSDALQTKLMYHNDFDERIMINAVMLLLRSLPLHKGSHLLYVSAHEVWNIHQSHSREMHQKSDMVCIKARESTLTAEVSNDEFH